MLILADEILNHVKLEENPVGIFIFIVLPWINFYRIDILPLSLPSPETPLTVFQDYFMPLSKDL